MTTPSAALRAQLRRILSWQDAHVGFEKSVEGLSPKLRGARVVGFPHSAWELLEHMRITQHDILDFCRNPDYEEIAWPDAYWPKSPAPPSDGAWADNPRIKIGCYPVHVEGDEIRLEFPDRASEGALDSPVRGP